VTGKVAPLPAVIRAELRRREITRVGRHVLPDVAKSVGESELAGVLGDVHVAVDKVTELGL